MNVTIEINGIKTYREGNGLAKSSRNELLSKNAKNEKHAIQYKIRILTSKFVNVQLGLSRHLFFLHLCRTEALTPADFRLVGPAYCPFEGAPYWPWPLAVVL